jgi:hypothetical protein
MHFFIRLMSQQNNLHMPCFSVGEVLSAFSAGSTAVHIASRCGNIKCIGKSKAIPATDCGGRQSCQMSTLSHFLDSWLTDGVEAVSLTRRLHFTPRRILGLLICLKIYRLKYTKT